MSIIEDKPELNIQIIFRGLIKHSDCGTNYPLVKTMEEFDKHCKRRSKVNIIFDSKELEIKGNLSQTFKKLLPINRNNAFIKKIEAKEEKKASEEKIEFKEELLIGTAEKLSYYKNQIGSAFSEAGRLIAESSTVAKLSDAKHYISNGAADYYYSYKGAERLLVTLEISQLNLLTTISLLKKFRDDHCQKICFVIHNPKNKIVQTINQNKLFSPYVEMIIFDSNTDKNYTMQIKTEIIEVKDELPKIFDLIFSANNQKEALSLLEDLQDKLKILEHDNQLLMINLDLTFYQISQKQADQLFESKFYAAKLSFNGLKAPSAKHVIYLADEHYNNAIFEFPDLNASESKILVEHADRKNQDFSIGSKPLENELLKISPAISISEYKAIGYIFIFDLLEKNPLPWKAMSIVSLAAVLQIAAGATLMVCTAGFGASVGMGLVTEGVADILRIINAGYSRNFSMTDYLMQKSMSMTISLITAGWAASSGAEEAVNLVDEAASAANAARQSVMQATTATKCIAIKAGESFAAEGSRVICSTVSSAAASSMRPTIIKYAYDIVEKEFSAGYIHGVIQKVFAADCFVYENQEKYHEEQIRLAGKESLHSVSFAMPGIELFDLSGVDQFHNNFREKIIGIEKQLDQFNVLLHHRLHHIEKMKVSQNDVNKMCELLTHKKILSENGNINLSEIRKYLRRSDPVNAQYAVDYEIKNYNFSNLNLEPYNDHREKLLAACLSYHCAFTDDYSLKINRFSKDIAALLADRFQASVDTAARLAGSAAAGLINWGVSNQSDKLRKQITLNDSLLDEGLIEDFNPDNAFEEALTGNDLSEKNRFNVVKPVNDIKNAPGVVDKIPERKIPLDEHNPFELKTAKPLSANHKMGMFNAPKNKPDPWDDLGSPSDEKMKEMNAWRLQEDMKPGAYRPKISDAPTAISADISPPMISKKPGDCFYESLSPHFNNCPPQKIRMDIANILEQDYEANPNAVIKKFTAHLKKCLSGKNNRVGLPEDMCISLKKIGSKMGDLDLMLGEYAKESFPRYLKGIKEGEIWGDFFQLESFAKAKNICVTVKTINSFTGKKRPYIFGNPHKLKSPDKVVQLDYQKSHYSLINSSLVKRNIDPHKIGLTSPGIGGIEITDPKLPSNLRFYRHKLRGRTVFFTQGKRLVGRGSATTGKVRAYCNNPASPVPSRFSQRSSIGGLKMRTETYHPFSPGVKDAGHLFPRQLGGPGHMEEFIIPQNPSHNRGGDWRQHEKLLCNEAEKNPEKIVSHVVVAYHSSGAKL